MDLKQIMRRPKALQAALRKITERLANELAQPAAEAPDWSEWEWTLACAVAVTHGVSPLLARVLRWQGPLRWKSFLEQQRHHTFVRHARIDALLRRIHRHAQDRGIAGVALKGAALHAIGMYSAGERPMADIDLWVRPADAGGTAAMLAALDYRMSFACWKETVFTPVEQHAPADLGEHSQNDIKIELHTRVCERLPLWIVDASERLFPIEPRPGLNPYPSPASLMLHLLLHAAGAMAFQALRLLHLNDIACLCARLNEDDWDEILNSRLGGEALWWAFPPLWMTSLYYPAAVPSAVMTLLAECCPWLLRRVTQRKTLCDVSYSHLWVDAFPGIEWCQSFEHMVQFAATRIRPSQEHMALRRMTPTTQAWASVTEWTSLSQGRRILRGLLSRQTRAATLHGINASIARAP